MILAYPPEGRIILVELLPVAAGFPDPLTHYRYLSRAAWVVNDPLKPKFQLFPDAPGNPFPIVSLTPLLDLKLRGACSVDRDSAEPTVQGNPLSDTRMIGHRRVALREGAKT